MDDLNLPPISMTVSIPEVLSDAKDTLMSGKSGGRSVRSVSTLNSPTVLSPTSPSIVATTLPRLGSKSSPNLKKTMSPMQKHEKRMAGHMSELRKFSDTQAHKDPAAFEDGIKETNPLILEFEQSLMDDPDLQLVMAIRGHPATFHDDLSPPSSSRLNPAEYGMVTPAVSVQSVTHVRDDDSDDPALSIHPSLELGLDPPQVVRPLSSPDKKSTGGLPLGPGIWTRLSPVAEAVSNRSHSGTSSKASGKFSYPSTPLHGLVTVGVADDLPSILSPAKTPREFFGRTAADKKEQCYRVYKGIGHKGYDEFGASSGKMTQLSQQSRSKSPPKLHALVRAAEHDVDLRRGDLDDAAAETVAASISVVSGLRLLRVAHNRLTHLGVSKLLAKLDTSSLIVLDLGDNNLGDRGAFIVAKCLESCGNLMSLNVEKNRIGDIGLSTLAAAVFRCPKLGTLILRQNRIADRTAAGVGVIVSGEKPSKAELRRKNPKASGAQKKDTASDTTVASMGAVEMVISLKPLQASHQNLTNLDMSWGSMPPSAVAKLMEGFDRCNHIQTLDLSWNGIGTAPTGAADRSPMKLLISWLTFNVSVTHLNLSHNNIGVADGAALSKALEFNSTLRGLHLNGNAVTTDSNVFVVPRLSLMDVTGLSSGMDHMGLSPKKARSWMAFTSNGDLEDSEEELGDKDPGLSTAEAQEASAQVDARIIFPVPSDAKVNQFDLLCGTETCWICGNWRPYTFEWRSPQSGPLATAAVLVATSFNQWKPFPLFQQDDGGWARRVMVPHGRFTFLFEVDGVTRVSENEMYEPTASKSRHLSELVQALVTNDLSLFDSDGHLRSSDGFVNFVPSESELQSLKARQAAAWKAARESDKRSIAVTKAFSRTVYNARKQREDDISDAPPPPEQKDGDDPEDYESAAGVTIRTQAPMQRHKGTALPVRLYYGWEGDPVLPRITSKPRPVAVRAPWSRSGSVFAESSVITKEMISKAVDIDIKYSKIGKLAKNAADAEGIKQLFVKHFHPIMAIFHEYASRGTISDVFNIQWKNFTEFAFDVKLIDRSHITLADVDTLFVAVNANRHNFKLNPDRSVCRYELLEALVRMACMRYLKDGTVDTVTEALDKFLTENVLPNATYDSNFHFAKEYLWKEEVDMAFKAYRPNLDDIHAKFSGRFEVGEQRKMSVFEFVEVFQLAGIVPHHVHERVVRDVFVSSIALNVDELQSDRHMFMTKVEFYEAIGRVAYFVTTVPGFVKRLLFVLEAVAGIVQTESSNYVPTEVVTSITDRKPGRAALKAVLSFASKAARNVMKVTPSMASLLAKTPAVRAQAVQESDFRFSSDVVDFRDKYSGHEVHVNASVSVSEDPTFLSAVAASRSASPSPVVSDAEDD